mmetsp:Transcript_8914/g.9891  ORF Transcript_8914/g.9891 Transcript_8914/m.9891 type:complete len:339 (-) Transcript_8914:55-1071(-)
MACGNPFTCMANCCCGCFNVFRLLWLGGPESFLSIQFALLCLVAALNSCFPLGGISKLGMLGGIVALSLLIFGLMSYSWYADKRALVSTGLGWVVGAIIIGAGVFMASFLFYTVEEYRINTASFIPLSKAEFSQYDAFYFRDTVYVETNYIGQHVETSHGSGAFHFSCVAPIFSNESSYHEVNKTAYAWAHCGYEAPKDDEENSCKTIFSQGDHPCLSRWNVDVNAGVRVVNILGSKKGIKAIEAADAAYPITVFENVPIIMWEDPDTVYAAWLFLVKLFMIVPNVLWFTLTLIALPGLFVARYKRKQQGGEFIALEDMTDTEGTKRTTLDDDNDLDL